MNGGEEAEMAQEARCPKCGATFDAEAAALEHERTAHGVGSGPPQPRALACPACGMRLPTPQALRAHGQAMHPTSATPAVAARSVRPGRTLAWGALGGFVGGLGLWVTMAITGKLLSLPVTMLGVIGQAMFGLSASSNSAIVAGLALHLVSSLLIGVVVSAVLLGLSRSSDRFSRAFFPATASRVASSGLLAGLVVFVAFGLPMLMGVLAPTMHSILTNMMEMLGASPSTASVVATTKLDGLLPSILAGFFIGHLVYGLLVGAVVYGGVRWQLNGRRAATPRGAQTTA